MNTNTNTNTNTELVAFLGNTADLTAEQAADLERVAERVAARFDAAELDDTEPAMEALSGAVMAAVGDATVESLAHEMRAARAAAERAYYQLAGAMMWEQQHTGESDYKLAARTGQARGTGRKALGV